MAKREGPGVGRQRWGYNQQMKERPRRPGHSRGAGAGRAGQRGEGQAGLREEDCIEPSGRNQCACPLDTTSETSSPAISLRENWESWSKETCGASSRLLQPGPGPAKGDRAEETGRGSQRGKECQHGTMNSKAVKSQSDGDGQIQKTMDEVKSPQKVVSASLTAKGKEDPSGQGIWVERWF